MAHQCDGDVKLELCAARALIAARTLHAQAARAAEQDAGVAQYLRVLGDEIELQVLQQVDTAALVALRVDKVTP